MHVQIRPFVIKVYEKNNCDNVELNRKILLNEGE